MAKYTLNPLAGVNPPVVTIFDENGKIDYAANKKQADFLIEKGVHGLAYLGTSGEFSLLTLEEKKEFIREMAAYVNHRANVIMGAGDTCLEVVQELLKAGEEAHVDGFLIINPYYNIYTEKDVEAYYDVVAESTKLPIIIYNFPGLSGFGFQPPLVERLVKKHRNIVGIKETVPDTEHIRAMLKIKEIAPYFNVYAAYECHAMTVLPLGADGFIGATVNFAPEFTVKAFNAYKEGNIEEAAKYSLKMNEAMDVYGCSTPLFLACKEAVYQRVLGEDRHGERLPARPLTKEAKQQVGEILKRLGLL